MKQRLLRILSILCILALACGCLTLSAFAEEDIKLVTVLWEDDNNYDGLRPTSEGVTISYGGTSVTLNEGNNWTGTITAVSGTDWSIPTVSGYVKSESGADGVKVVTYRLSKATSDGQGTETSYGATAKWADEGNAYGTRPATSPKITLLADGVPCRASADVKLNVDETSVSWTELNTFKKGTKRTEKIAYSVTADDVPGYTVSVSGNNIVYTLEKGSLKLTTSLNPPAGADISGLHLTVSGPYGFSKELFYNDVAGGSYDFGEVLAGAYVVEDQNASGLIPGYVIDPDGSNVADGVYVKDGEEKELSFGFTWKKEESYTAEEGYKPEANYKNLTFRVLGPDYDKTFTYGQFDENGQLKIGDLLPGTYVVFEMNAEGLVRKYNLQSDSTTGVATLVEANKEAIAKLYNEYKPGFDDESINIPVTKIWNDNGNRDGNRPGSITVNLQANGTTVASHALTGDEGWQYVFANMPRYDKDRKEITYTINENPVAWYDGSVNGYFVTNDYNPETTTASVYKIWDDNDNERNLRPKNIAVTLLPTGKIYMLTAANDWSLTVDNLPTKLNGKDVTYSWKEEESVGYVLAGTEVSGNSVVFYNHATNVPKIPEWMPQAKVPGDMWFIFEEYETALGGEILINHVGDCFD